MLGAVRARLSSVGSIIWGREVAEAYDETYSAKFEDSALAPTVELLAELSRGGPASSSQSVPDGWRCR